MLQLLLYHDYSRENVHDIFSPNTRFIPNTGTWGLQGIVPIHNTQNLVLFVTLGSKQGSHTFREGITKDGILNWQSQPKQRLVSPRIIQLIHHNELDHDIHLFFRTHSGQLYTYLGRLAYVTHNPTQEQPVYFLWQILDWAPTDETIQKCQVSNDIIDVNAVTRQGYLLTESLQSYVTTGIHINRRYSPHIRSGNHDFSQEQHRNSEIGAAGEEAIYDLEKQLLIETQRPDLAEQVYLTRDREGNAAPYDIHSFYPDGRDKYIEVKTTVTNDLYGFFISHRERQFASEHTGSYVLFRLYNFDWNSGEYSYYTVDNIEAVSYTHLMWMGSIYAEIGAESLKMWPFWWQLQ